LLFLRNIILPLQCLCPLFCIEILLSSTQKLLRDHRDVARRHDPPPVRLPLPPASVPDCARVRARACAHAGDEEDGEVRVRATSLSGSNSGGLRRKVWRRQAGQAVGTVARERRGHRCRSLPCRHHRRFRRRTGMQIETFSLVQLQGYRLTGTVVNSAMQFEKILGSPCEMFFFNLPEISKIAKHPAYSDNRFYRSWRIK
jgi:hypothetical protein